MAEGKNHQYTVEGTEALLFVHPKNPPSSKPLIDSLTKKMTAAYRKTKVPDHGYRGYHTCSCGATSSNKDPYISGQFTTNSLCVHYLAFHRQDIPIEDLKFVENLQYGEEEPNEKELSYPKETFNNLKSRR